MELMTMNRHERRALAKFNGIKKIAGSIKPYVKTPRGEKSDR